MVGSLMTKLNHMKKILVSILILPAMVHAGDEPTASPFPESKKGINIWPIEKVNMPAQKATIRSFKESSAKGYFESHSTDQSVNFLFDTAKTASKERVQYDKDTNPLDTHLKSDISKVRIGFKFSGIPGIPQKDILGFAAAGGYTHEKGWDGIAEFVQIPDIGICSFTTFAIESVIMYKETLEYLVNKKPSEKGIEGNWNAGFIYHVNWYTDTRRNAFECANRKLQPSILKKMVSIANQIDNGLT